MLHNITRRALLLTITISMMFAIVASSGAITSAQASDGSEAKVSLPPSTIVDIEQASPIYNNTGDVTIRTTASGESLASANWTLSKNGAAIEQANITASVEGLTTASLSSSFFDLTEGTYIFSITANDTLGGSATDSVVIIVDVTLPTVDILTPADGSVNTTGQVTIAWNGDDTLAGIDHYNVNVDNGTWTNFTIPAGTEFKELSGLADGSYTVHVQAVDLAGNTAEDTVGFIVDSEGPSVSFSTPSPHYTNATDVTVSFDASDAVPMASANWTLYYNGSMIGRMDITSSVDGRTTATYTHGFTLSKGTSRLYLTVNDTAGNSATYEYVIVVDTTIPDWANLSPEDGSYVTTHSVPLTWRATDVAGIDHYEFRFNGGAWSTRTDYSQLFTGLTDGSYNFEVKAYDRAGNHNYTKVTFIVDTVEPNLTILSPEEGSYRNVGSFTMSWKTTSTDIDHYEVSVDAGTWVSRALSKTFPLVLNDGEHTVTVRAFDKAGHITEAAVSFTVDTVKPMIEITSPANDTHINTTTATIIWTAQDDVGILNFQIRVDGGAWTSIWAANRTFTLQGLSVGNHQIELKAVDMAHNANTTSVTIVVDQAAPTATYSPTGSGVAIDSVIVVRFSEAMNQSSVSIVVSGVTGAVTWSGNNATFTPNAPLGYGLEYTVNVSGRDLAGNAYDGSSTFTTIEVGSIEGRVVDASGKPLVNVTITLSNGATATTNATGHFAFANVEVGSYIVTFSKDGYVAGNTTATVVVDQVDEIGDIVLKAQSSTTGGDMTLIIALVAIIAVAGLVGFFLIRRRK